MAHQPTRSPSGCRESGFHLYPLWWWCRPNGDEKQHKELQLFRTSAERYRLTLQPRLPLDRLRGRQTLCACLEPPVTGMLIVRYNGWKALIPGWLALRDAWWDGEKSEEGETSSIQIQKRTRAERLLHRSAIRHCGSSKAQSGEKIGCWKIVAGKDRNGRRECRADAL